jgi:hypothetical protein
MFYKYLYECSDIAIRRMPLLGLALAENDCLHVFNADFIDLNSQIIL